MAEFASAQALLDAAKRTHEAGYQKMDAYSPFPSRAWRKKSVSITTKFRWWF